MCLGNILASSGQDQRATQTLVKCVEVDPQFWTGWTCLARNHAVAGRLAETREAAQRAIDLSPNIFTKGLLAGALRAAGETTQSEALLAELPSQSNAGYSSISGYYLVIGDIDQAIECLIDDIQNFPLVAELAIFPCETRLRQSPAWPRLLRKLNLPETR
jgi:tetratricopeptide (TPR) repeat protein